MRYRPKKQLLGSPAKFKTLLLGTAGNSNSIFCMQMLVFIIPEEKRGSSGDLYIFPLHLQEVKPSFSFLKFREIVNILLSPMPPLFVIKRDSRRAGILRVLPRVKVFPTCYKGGKEAAFPLQFSCTEPRVAAHLWNVYLLLKFILTGKFVCLMCHIKIHM